MSDNKPAWEAVWAAIEDKLRLYGDIDVRSGIAWLDDAAKKAVAEAAIIAVKEQLTKGAIR